MASHPMAVDEEANAPGGGGDGGTAGSALQKLSKILSSYDVDPSRGAAALMSETRQVFRSIGGDLSASDYRTLEGLAVRMFDLQLPANDDAEQCADVQLFACRLIERCLESAGGDNGGGQERSRELLFSLCERQNHTAAAYQKCGAHAKAVSTLDKAASNVSKALSLGVHNQNAGERLQRLQMEVFYKKIELLCALESVPTYAGKSKQVVQEAREVIVSRQLPAPFSFKFGTLCYNLAVMHIKNEGGGHEAAREALFWSEQAAQFFNGQDCRAQHAASKSLSAKARIAINDVDNALNDLKVANMLDPIPRSLLLELQCLVLMNRHDDANTLLANAITEDNWKKAASSGADTDAKRTLIRAWVRFALFLTEANLADAANETFGRLVAITRGDPDHRYYEEAHFHWVTALACSSIRDLSACSAQVQALTRHHVEVQCSPLTQKRVLVLFTKVIEELDATGSHRKAIEWRQKAISWASEGDGIALAKQIVRIGMRVGAMDVAEQYLARCGSQDCDLLILKMQVLFKKAKPGDSTEDEVVAMLTELMSTRKDMGSVEAFELLNAAFTEAHSAGYAVCARKAMQSFVERIVACSPEERKDVMVHQVFANTMQLLFKLTPKDGDKALNVELAAGVEMGEVVDVLDKAFAFIEKNGAEAFGHGQEEARQTLVLMSEAAWNMAVKVGSVPVGDSDAPDYREMSRLYHMCAKFLLRLGQESEPTHVADACISLYLSSASALLSHRCKMGAGAEHGDLKQAIESVRMIRSVRTEHGLTASPNSSLSEARLEFELGCLVGVGDGELHRMGASFVKEVLPTLKDNAARLAGLKALLGVCSKTRAAWIVTKDLCEATLSLVSEMGTSSDDLVATVADVQMLRIASSCEQGEEKLSYFEDMLTTSKAHQSAFPSPHMHQAAIIAFNKGDQHLHWERLKQAEQWIGMAVRIATASSSVPAESKAKMQEAYGACLEALRA